MAVDEKPVNLQLANDRLTAAKIAVRNLSPFFSTLVLFAQFEFCEEHNPPLDGEIPVAATNGKKIWINAKWWNSVTSPQRAGVLMHEVLHCALDHLLRIGTRDVYLWNVATDISINGMIRDMISTGYDLPQNLIEDPALKDYASEEIYAIIQRNRQNQKQQQQQQQQGQGQPQQGGGGGGGDQDDGQSGPPQKGGKGGKGGKKKKPQPGQGGGSGQPDPSQQGPSPTDPSGGKTYEDANPGCFYTNGDGEDAVVDHDSGEDANELSEAWKRALNNAVVAQRQSKDRGDQTAAMDRHLQKFGAGQVDWKSVLWENMVKTPTDFSGYDRRLFHMRLYIEELMIENVKVQVAADTSGSIGEKELGYFLAEINGILSQYPSLEGSGWWSDAEAYGPFEMDDMLTMRPIGGGGTDFRPFFQKIPDDAESIVVFLTDGYGAFPEEPPPMPVVWVVIPGGLQSEGFPFGKVIRLT